LLLRPCLDTRTLLPPVDHMNVGSWSTAVP